ncbi:MAG TPA: hypothetical protein VIJ15_14585, partial [Dermatophilaceae bacterium]
RLTDAQGSLNQSLDALKSPANLAARATDMGMVPATSAAFLRLSDGKVIGVATPAPPGHLFTVIAVRPPGVAKPASKPRAPAVGKEAGKAKAPAPSVKNPAAPAAATAAKPAKR